MKKHLSFKFPFYRFSNLNFYNCYASVYLFLQGTTVKNTDYYCQAIEGKGCNECWNCADSLQAKSEVLNNLFGMIISGQWITRQSWSGEKTKIQKEFYEEYEECESKADKAADFLIGFTGYDYRKITENFKESIVSTIDAGKPVIARIKEPKVNGDGMFRVIVGYDGDTLIDPDYNPADNAPKDPTVYDEIEYIYIFGEKVQQKHTFSDVIKIMEKAMDSDFSEGIWYDFAHNFDIDSGACDIPLGEIKKRFRRLRDIAGWIPNIGHGLQTTFGDKKLIEELGMDVGCCGELLSTIAEQGHLMHNRGYMLSAICDSVNDIQAKDTENCPWDKHGLITSAYQILDSVIDCDLRILIAIKKAIRKLA